MAYAISKDEEQKIALEALKSVVGIMELFKINHLDNNMRDALIEAYIAGATNTINYLKGSYEDK